MANVVLSRRYEDGGKILEVDILDDGNVRFSAPKPAGVSIDALEQIVKLARDAQPLRNPG